ncbi:hypothetical protein [Castellaniella sp.]|uniref:hypothetical protein n=1 Tax=Castellaniella sp. TaxID=1955812 RepID=UPI002AFF41E4|nr:hypothetical protein [Castellaniella sp.]
MKNPIFPSIHKLKAILIMAGTLLAGIGLSHAAPADDMARLYALPPAGSVYVRVVNATNRPLDASLAGQVNLHLPPNGASMVSGYYPVDGNALLSLSADQQTLSADPAPPGTSFISLLVLEGSEGLHTRTIADKGVAADGLKAELAVYNLIPGCTAQIALESGQSVFTDIDFESRNVRAINPVSTGLVGRCDAQKSSVFMLQNLKSGDHFSLFLIGNSHAPILIGALNQIMPTSQ